MDLGLKGRVSFVSGASSGLGYAAARELVLEGSHVAICSRSKDRIEAAARRLADEVAEIHGGEGAESAGIHGPGTPDGASGGDVLPIVCDVTDETSIGLAISEALSTFGKLNVLITNAGGPPAGYIDDLSTSQWRHALDLNLMSTINLCRAALPHLREAARQEDALARILMITSVSAKQPIPNLYLSNTARAGVQGFAKSLSEELGEEGITVNTILPGYTRTDRLRELAESITEKTGKSLVDVESEWAEHAALKRIADPAEFAAAAAFLVSKRASYVTGMAFPVDGGRVKHLL